MNPNIATSLDRADELLADLVAQYNASLQAKEVSARAIHLTHEVCERLRSVLDRTMRRYWEKHISPSLSAEDRKAATVYFPVSIDQNGFDSTLGRWRWKAVRIAHQDVYEYLLSQQPFTSSTNCWLTILNDLAVQGKHIDLVPQKRNETVQITVTGAGGGSVSWGPGVSFGSGVYVVGAPVDPQTQRIVPTPGVSEKMETWVSFMIQGHDVDAGEFCRNACRDTRLMVTHLSDKFGL